MDYDDLIRQGKIKRLFRATRKVIYPGFVSHITQRAAGKEPLFVEDGDYLYMLANMKHIAKNRSLDIYAFCLMQNHVHLLLSPREDELQEPMRDLFSRYAMMFNRKYERKGHLFAGPYRQAICLDDAYLLAASLYIHMNPVRAGIVDDPLDYRWPSVKLFYGEAVGRSFVKPGFVLRLLGRTVQEQKRVYTEILNRSVSLEQDDVLENSNAMARFCKALAGAFPSVFTRVGKKKHIARQTGLEMLAEEELGRRIVQMKSGKVRMSTETRKARRFLIEQLVARGYKRDQIAVMLGISVKTVYNSLKVGR